MAIEDVVKDAHDRMGKSVEALRRELDIIRTGRASPRLLDSIQVNYIRMIQRRRFGMIKLLLQGIVAAGSRIYAAHLKTRAHR